MSKDKSKFSKQMFEIKCTVTGESKKVRKTVFMSRVGRVQRLVRSITGDQITVAEAINALAQNYVGIVGRKTEGCDFLGQPMLFAQAMALKPKRVRKAKTAKAAVNAIAKVVAKVIAPKATPGAVVTTEFAKPAAVAVPAK